MAVQSPLWSLMTDAGSAGAALSKISAPTTQSVPKMAVEDAYKALRVTAAATWEAIESSRRQIVDRARPVAVSKLSAERCLALQQEARRANAAYAVITHTRSHESSEASKVEGVLVTLAAATITPATGEPFVVVSMYAPWETSHATAKGQWKYADASAHRVISDLAVFIGRPSGHRILAAEDLNILHGYGDHGSSNWAARYAHRLR